MPAKKEPLSPQSKGGFARAKALDAKTRSAIAREGAAQRWNADVPRATHEGVVKIGDTKVSAAVLPNGKRLLTQATLLRAIGRSRSPKAGTGVMNTVDGLPFFLQAEVLKPFIDNELRLSTTPIFFLGLTGTKAVGYDAQLLPQVAEVYLKFRDAYQADGKPIPRQYQHIVRACDVLLRGLASVGIVALVDEATGFQEVRSRDALSRILEAFVQKELKKWVRTFPADYYEQLFRLRGLAYPPDNMKMPQYIGALTNNIVYDRLAPGVKDELKRLTPRDLKGRPKAKMFQHLTDDVGSPKLREHLASVVTLMKISPDYSTFERHLNQALPKWGDTLQLNIAD